MSRFPAYPSPFPLCGAVARAGDCLGEGRNPSPSFASSRQGSTNRLSQPPFSFSFRLYVVSLSLRISVLQDYGGAHPLVMDALAAMSEGQMQMRLTHPPVRAQGRIGMRAELPRIKIADVYLRNSFHLFFYKIHPSFY